MKAMVEAGKHYKVTVTAIPGCAYAKFHGTEKKFTAVVNWVEDRGDRWYIGFEPDTWQGRLHICQWGTCSVLKQGQHKAINYTFEEV